MNLLYKTTIEQMKSLKDIAIEIAREAGQFLKARLDSVHKIGYKGEINLVTEARQGL